MSISGDKKTNWTVLELVNWTTAYLSEKQFENSRLNAELLLAHTLNFTRMSLYLNFDKPLQPEELQQFKLFLKRRLQNEPLQYILGSTEFMSLPFNVKTGALIPRPETELLVEMIINYYKTSDNNKEPLTILDIGTGSGNISVSLAHYLPNSQIVAVDVSEAALAIARENAELNHVTERIRFIQHDALNPMNMEYNHYFNVIVSNPPYISSPEFNALPVEIKDFEPQTALYGGEDGLDYYRQFILTLLPLLKDQGSLYFEIGETQANSILELYKNTGFENMTVHKDLAGKDRIVEMNRINGKIS